MRGLVVAHLKTHYGMRVLKLKGLEQIQRQSVHNRAANAALSNVCFVLKLHGLLQNPKTPVEELKKSNNLTQWAPIMTVKSRHPMILFKIYSHRTKEWSL